MKKILLLLVTTLVLCPVVYAAAEVEKPFDDVTISSNYAVLAPKELIEKNIAKISAITTARMTYNTTLCNFMLRKDVPETAKVKIYCQAFGGTNVRYIRF